MTIVLPLCRLSKNVVVAASLLISPWALVFAEALGTVATDGKNYSSTVTVTITPADSTTAIKSALVGQSVNMSASVSPGPAHAGQVADVFVVNRINNAFYMRTLDGRFVPWSGKIPDLQPALEKVKLTTDLKIDVYSGQINAASSHRIFVGYMPAGGSALVYTPVPAPFDIAAPTLQVAPLTYFSDHIEAAILPRCLACHVSGGVAKDSKLILERTSGTSVQNNFNSFGLVAAEKGIGYILTKVTGGNDHGGAVQLNQGSSDYNNLATFLQLQQGSTEVLTANGNEFFNGVTLQTRPETLRRAAIILSARAPTQTELQAVAKGDENTLRSTLKSLMTGDGFHKFLTDGTNDRLLLRGVLGPVINPAFPYHAKYLTELYNARLQARNAGKTEFEIRQAGGMLSGLVDLGLRRSVEELVASIVERDRPYTEVLTADYMMMTPSINFVMEGGASFINPANSGEYQPGRINNYFLFPPSEGRSIVEDKLLGFYFTKEPTIKRPWSHVGILNHPAFLTRYPTTATNRNRARARWAMLHFLDIDIEKSSQRPTDPAALADRNNPTMNNPACTACHERMDPVAAAFQDYSDEGFYRIHYDDSLDPFYKYPIDKSPTPYQQGDTWYRDMRPAGLFGQRISDRSDPMRQLANLIVKDAGFARATVKFWWPSVMNSEVLLAPAVSTDSDYAAKLAAYQAQAASIEQFAANFRKDYNLKNLLVDMLMSPWFRAEATTNGNQRAAMAIADVGVEKLLTPERLARKSAALTGFNWGGSSRPSNPYDTTTELENNYNTLYGGIDSFAVTKRARDMSPLMSSVAQSYALQSSCPVILKEFALEDSLRKLFNGITHNDTPLSQGSITAEVTSANQTDWKTIGLTLDLSPGPNLVTVSLDNTYCDFDAINKRCITQRVLYLDRFEIRAPGQASFQLQEFTAEMASGFTAGCYRSNNTDALTFGGCAIPLSLDVKTAGTYEIRAVVAATQAGVGNVQTTLRVAATGDPLTSNARGATLIRKKLVELFGKLHGKTYTLDSPEVTAVYQLFVQTWQDRIKAGTPGLASAEIACNFYKDQNFLSGLGYPGNGLTPARSGGDWYDWDNDKVFKFVADLQLDPAYTKQSWVVVMVYLLSHYNFLYE